MIQLYAAVCEVCMQTLSILLWSSSTWPFSSCSFQFSVQIPSTICFWPSLFFFFLPFFFWSAKLGGLRACRLTPPHLMRLLVIVLSNKRLYSLKLFIVFKEMCYWTALHAGHVWFFFFCAWRCPFCRMTPAWHSYFIYGLLTFLGQQQKSDRTSHPLDIYTCAFQLCWSAPPSAVIRLQWMRYALMEVARRGSWCEGEKKRKSPFTFLEV